MSAEVKREIALEIAHVLFIDTVGYSQLSINEQRAVIDELTQVVRDTEQFQKAEASERLIKISTGDGMALVFYTSLEAPVRCAMELSRVLKDHPRLRLRMGIHSGPVSGVVDVTGRTNLAGAGINTAQRVMNCGDAGHILVSKHVAEDLEEYDEWRPLLHDLGECEVKHGARVSVANLYTEELGNPAIPEKLKAARAATAAAAAAKRKRTAFRWTSVGVLALFVAVTAIGFLFFRYAPRLATRALAVPEKSIAVLPFNNLSKDEANAFFADGVQDEILSNLAKVADLKVISRTSVMLYKAGNPRNLREIGHQLGVAHVLEGNVQRAGGKVRVNAQLVDTRTDKHLWGQTYDRDLADVFAIQSEIAQSIANELQAKISASERAAIEEQPTKDLAAYDLYVRAIPLFPKAAGEEGKEQAKDYLQAVDLLNQAVARDPGFLLAYCRLAEAHDELYFIAGDHTPNRLALAKTAIDAAFRLKPDSGEAHLALAAHFYHGYLDYDRARDELAIALRTLPNNARLFEWSGFIDRRQNRWHDAVRNHERALELDPRNIMIVAQAALTYRLMRDYGQARATTDRLIALEPNNILYRFYRAWIEVWALADLRPVQGLLGKNFTDNPALLRTNASACFLIALYGRNHVAADNALAAITDNTFGLRGGVEITRAYAEGLVASMKGDDDRARSAFSAARTEQEKIACTQPDDRPQSGDRPAGIAYDKSRALCSLGLIDAALGRKQEALNEGRRAVELLPVAKNALDGPEVLYFYAVICAQVGERDLAIEQLKPLAQIPAGAHYGELRLDPFWDPLRGDPRFEKIVASLAPKEAASK
jgi:TolB-like protein/class 3 adenylate cyclase/Flp pilus assembly protein TadD